ncbi:hypothetical protein Efla_005263 [Eimeria flavescens]
MTRRYTARSILLLLQLPLLLVLQQQALGAAAMAQGSLRYSSHAGTWFPGSAADLRSAVDAMLDAAPAARGTVKAVIVPHAGYLYSGHTAAFSYKQIMGLNRSVKRVVVLAAWHRGHPGLLLPPEEYSGFGTPIGSVPLDTEALSALLSTGLYDTAPKFMEADEHSIAVQIPFLKRVLPEGAVLLPIYVGTVADDELALYAETLVPFFMDPDTVFVISTDWSHWGPRHALDQKAIKCVLALDVSCLEEHVRETQNQICGFDALRLFLSVRLPPLQLLSLCSSQLSLHLSLSCMHAFIRACMHLWMQQ